MSKLFQEPLVSLINYIKKLSETFKKSFIDWQVNLITRQKITRPFQENVPIHLFFL